MDEVKEGVDYHRNGDDFPPLLLCLLLASMVLPFALLVVLAVVL